MRAAGFIRMLDKGVVAPLVVVAAWLRPRHPPKAQSGSWVAIKLVGMGDAVLMLPALAAMRAAGQRVSVVTTARCAEIFTASGCTDEMIVLSQHGLFGQMRTLLRTLRGCQAVLDFEQHVFWSAALVMLAPAGVRRYGFHTQSWMRNRAYDQRVDPGCDPRPMKEIFDDLARAAGFNPAPELRRIVPGAEAAAAVDAWLRAQGLAAGRFLAVAPGSSLSVLFRRLSAPTWAEVLGRLPPDLPVVVVGAAAEAQLITEIVHLVHIVHRTAVPEEAGVQMAIGVNFNLRQLAALFERAAAVVAIDSGPMHLAAAMGCAVAGIFGPDTPRRYAPYNGRSVSISLNLPCSPCNNCWVYREPRCTNPETYACIQRLSPAQIVPAVQAVLAPRLAGAGGRTAAEGADDDRQHHRTQNGH